MNNHSKKSFKVLLGLLLLVLGALIGILWGRLHTKTAPSHQVIYAVQGGTPHMSSMFPHPHGPAKHRMLVTMGQDMQKALGFMQKVSQDFSAHTLHSMHRLAHHSFNPALLLKEFFGGIDGHPGHFHHEVGINRGSRGGSQIYRVDVLDAF
ncbi:MAG: hypothetical protein FJX18_03910 [Alphaproteobacteria bacterium]|nr:hypothetical protein [Alphaproteobacteria bacterium]